MVICRTCSCTFVFKSLLYQRSLRPSSRDHLKLWHHADTVSIFHPISKHSRLCFVVCEVVVGEQETLLCHLLDPSPPPSPKLVIQQLMASLYSLVLFYYSSRDSIHPSFSSHSTNNYMCGSRLPLHAVFYLPLLDQDYFTSLPNGSPTFNPSLTILRY